MAFRRWRPPAPIARRRDGRFDVAVSDNERRTLDTLLESVDAVLAGDPTDPRARRLFPVAYHDHPEADEEYRRLMRPELVESTRATVATARRAVASREPLEESDVLALMRGLNSMRLVLGTMLDVGEDDGDPDPEDPDQEFHVLYAYVGWLIDSIVDVVSEG